MPPNGSEQRTPHEGVGNRVMSRLRRNAALQADNAPPDGHSAHPPSPPTGTILDEGVPTLDLYEDARALDRAVRRDEIDIAAIEKRTTLLARLVVESALWEVDGWSKKERVDAALRAISTIEGQRTNLWVKGDGERRAPLTHAELEKERDAADERVRRLVRLIRERRGGSIDLAEEVDEAHNVIEEMAGVPSGDDEAA